MSFRVGLLVHLRIPILGPPLQSLTDNIVDELLAPSSGFSHHHHYTNDSVFAGSPEASRRNECPTSPVYNHNTTNNQQLSTSTAAHSNGPTTGAPTIRRLDEGFEDAAGEREGDGSLMTVVWNYLFG